MKNGNSDEREAYAREMEKAYRRSMIAFAVSLFSLAFSLWAGGYLF